MSVSTCGKLKNRVYPEEILEYIRTHIDKNASMNIKSEEYEQQIKPKEIYDKSNKIKRSSGYICFNIKNQPRSMFYLYSNVNYYENLDYYKTLGLEDMVKSETTYISLGYDENSCEIIKSIVSYFGGWYDKNDCDSIPYERIYKTDDDMPNIIKLTHEELNKKLGGIVVIID